MITLRVKQQFLKPVLVIGLGLSFVSLIGCSAANSVGGTGNSTGTAFATTEEKTALASIDGKTGFMNSGSGGTGATSSSVSGKISIQKIDGGVDSDQMTFDGVSYQLPDTNHVQIDGKQFHVMFNQVAPKMGSADTRFVYLEQYISSTENAKTKIVMQERDTDAFNTHLLFQTITGTYLDAHPEEFQNGTVIPSDQFNGRVTYNGPGGTTVARFDFSGGTMMMIKTANPQKYLQVLDWPFQLTIKGNTFKGRFQFDGTKLTETALISMTSDLTTLDGTRKVGQITITDGITVPIKVRVYNSKGELEDAVSTQ